MASIGVGGGSDYGVFIFRFHKSHSLRLVGGEGGMGSEDGLIGSEDGSGVDSSIITVSDGPKVI